MAKDQELLQAVKSNDLAAFRKLVAKLKASKTSESYRIRTLKQDKMKC